MYSSGCGQQCSASAAMNYCPPAQCTPAPPRHHHCQCYKCKKRRNLPMCQPHHQDTPYRPNEHEHSGRHIEIDIHDDHQHHATGATQTSNHSHNAHGILSQQHHDHPNKHVEIDIHEDRSEPHHVTTQTSHHTPKMQDGHNHPRHLEHQTQTSHHGSSHPSHHHGHSNHSSHHDDFDHSSILPPPSFQDLTVHITEEEDSDPLFPSTHIDIDFHESEADNQHHHGHEIVPTPDKHHTVPVYRTETHTELKITEKPHQPSEIKVIQKPVTELVGYESDEDMAGKNRNKGKGKGCILPTHERTYPFVFRKPHQPLRLIKPHPFKSKPPDCPVRETIASILQKKPPAHCKPVYEKPFHDYCKPSLHAHANKARDQRFVDHGGGSGHNKMHNHNTGGQSQRTVEESNSRKMHNPNHIHNTGGPSQRTVEESKSRGRGVKRQLNQR